VDYAETRIGLEDLLRAVAADIGMVRVLLLARSAGQWWEQLAAGEGAIRDLVAEAGPEGTQLSEVLDEQLGDQEMVERALPMFAAALGVDPPDHVVLANSASRRARVLELHAAALVAVLDWTAAPERETPWVDLDKVLGEQQTIALIVIKRRGACGTPVQAAVRTLQAICAPPGEMTVPPDA
jgi:hypothetical protein